MEPLIPGESKPSTWEKVQTYTIVSVVAVLIWLYAESENVKIQEPLTLAVQFVAPPGQRLSIGPVLRQRVDLAVRCAASQYAQLQRIVSTPIQLTVREEPSSPNHPFQEISLRDQLIRDSIVGQLGVSVVEIKPERINLRVEQIELVTMPIEAVVPEGTQLAASPTIEPAQATVALPASVAKAFEGLKLLAQLTPDAVVLLEENISREITVPLTLPVERLTEDVRKQLGSASRAIDPASVEVTVTIRKQTSKLKLPGVPILVTAPWAELKRFNVEIEDGQRVLSEDVEVSGPSDVIDSINSGQVKIWAELRLTVDDLESAITSKQLHINVPSGVRIESAIPLVNLTITQVQGTGVQPAP